jgi:anaerobic ribonucleoside-triphosphate reductase activating protein
MEHGCPDCLPVENECASPFLIRVNRLDPHGSVCDGPGLRAVLYLQGCARACRGCHNPSTWDKTGGRVLEVRVLAEAIRRVVPTRRLTISGGEPLDQLPGLMDLVGRLRDFDLAVYTGYELAQVPDELLSLVNWIKVGPFDIALSTTVVPFIGSTNQRFLDAQDAFSARCQGVQ